MDELFNILRNASPEVYFHVFMQMVPGLCLGIFTGLSMWWGCHYLADNGKNFLAKLNLNFKWMNYALIALGRTHTLLFVVITAYVAVQLMPYMEAIDGPSHTVLHIFIILQVAAWLSTILKAWSVDYARDNRKKDPARVTMVETLLTRVGMMLIVLVMGMFLLVNFGVDITAMLAGFGIGGLAVAFAFQNILKDIFSSFSIVFDKPFVIDDFIASNDVMGSVEHIGMKTTRIRSLSGEQIIVSNDDLLSSRIKNFGRMENRRVVFNVRLDYDTPPDKVEKVPEFIKAALAKHGDDVRLDRSHFAGFGDWSLNFETVYFVTKADYGLMMNINQAVFLDLMRDFEREGIVFALPYQKLEEAKLLSPKGAEPAKDKSKAKA